MVARIFRFSVPHIWLAQNHTEWRWIDIPIGQGPSIVPMWLTGLKKWTRYGSMINLWGPDTYQFQSTCGFSVPTYKRSVCFAFFPASGCTHMCVRSATWNFLYAAFFHWHCALLAGDLDLNFSGTLIQISTGGYKNWKLEREIHFPR